MRVRIVVPFVLCTVLVLAFVAIWQLPTTGFKQEPGAPTELHAKPGVKVLPLGDGKTSTGARLGYVWECKTIRRNIGSHKSGPWIKGDGTWAPSEKVVVDGSVQHPGHLFEALSNGAMRTVRTSLIPNHPTGIYPIQKTDDAYAFDQNPNTIRSRMISMIVPKNPVPAESPSCLPRDIIGITVTGVPIFHALDSQGRDAPAHEIQDQWQGHPEPEHGTYHYHLWSSGLPDTASGHSALAGYALDGFGIYGMKGEGGKPLLTKDLDACHGHTHQILWDGTMVTMYHYHFTADFPYTLGCFHGAPGQLKQ